MAPVQPSASVAATGLGIRYIGQGKYAAWTGKVTSTGGSYSTALEFTSPSAAMIAEIYWVVNRANLGSAEDIAMRLTMNDVVVWDAINQLSYLDADPMKIVIPPYTKFKMEFMTSDSNDIVFSGVLVAESV